MTAPGINDQKRGWEETVLRMRKQRLEHENQLSSMLRNQIDPASTTTTYMPPLSTPTTAGSMRVTAYHPNDPSRAPYYMAEAVAPSHLMKPSLVSAVTPEAAQCVRCEQPPSGVNQYGAGRMQTAGVGQWLQVQPQPQRGQQSTSHPIANRQQPQTMTAPLQSQPAQQQRFGSSVHSQPSQLPSMLFNPRRPVKTAAPSAGGQPFSSNQSGAVFAPDTDRQPGLPQQQHQQQRQQQIGFHQPPHQPQQHQSFQAQQQMQASRSSAFMAPHLNLPQPSQQQPFRDPSTQGGFSTGSSRYFQAQH
jgi:hypothetical protein